MLSKACGSVDVGIKLFAENSGKTLNTYISLTFHPNCNWSHFEFVVVVVIIEEEK